MNIYSVIQRPNPRNNGYAWLPAGAVVTPKKGFVLVELPDGVEITTAPPDTTVYRGYPALDQTGALATLLVVNGTLPLADAANIAGCDTAQLIAEAQAWAAAEAGAPSPVVHRGRGRGPRPTA